MRPRAFPDRYFVEKGQCARRDHCMAVDECREECLQAAASPQPPYAGSTSCSRSALASAHSHPAPRDVRAVNGSMPAATRRLMRGGKAGRER